MNSDAASLQDDQGISDFLSAVVGASIGATSTDPRTRTQLIDLLSFPQIPVDRSAYSWIDVGPGLRLHVVSEDPSRGVKRCLVWGAPGAATERHGHGGDDVHPDLLEQREDSIQPGLLLPDLAAQHLRDVHTEEFKVSAASQGVA